MFCSSCSVDMVIDHTGKKVEGDSSPDTPTRIYEQQYFVCRNRQCSRYGQVVNSEPILIYDSGETTAETRQLTLPDEIVECCGNTLCSYNANSYTITNGVAATLKDGELSLTCPMCHNGKVLAVGNRENLDR